MSSQHNSRIAIVGRPNVGKSTLFNILTGTRKAVVRDEPGVTRDLQFGHCEWKDRVFEVIDTGGVTESTDLLPSLIREKVMDAFKMTDAIFFVCDGRAGMVPEDMELLRMVLEANKPFIVVVNKLDQESKINEMLTDFYQMGQTPIPCSFEKRQGIDDLLEWACHKLPPKDNPKIESEVTIAILGKPNVGKSSLTNHLIGENRMIVSPIAGTTVDAIDSTFEREGRFYTIIDTAGLRRKSKRKDGIEVLSSFKTIDSIKKAEIVLLMVDVLEGPAEQDAKILKEIQDEHKAVILVANKSDAATEQKIPEFRKKFRDQVAHVFHFYEDIPVIFTSAVTGSGVKSLFEKIDEIHYKMNTRISTGELNRFFTNVIRKAPAPVFRNQNVKFYYLTQTQQVPPSFIAFANHPDGVDTAYRRFLIKQIKAEFDLGGIPVRIFAMRGGGSQ